MTTIAGILTTQNGDKIFLANIQKPRKKNKDDNVVRHNIYLNEKNTWLRTKSRENDQKANTQRSTISNMLSIVLETINVYMRFETLLKWQATSWKCLLKDIL